MIDKFKGDKDCYGRIIAGHTIGGMRGGSVYDIKGVKFATYRRMVVNGGHSGNWQEIEFTIEETDEH